MRLAITADLHWGLSARGDAATRAVAAKAAELAPDALILAGDVGEGLEWASCLELFADLECPRLVLPGNHDLWTRDPSLSSRDLYERVLPEAAAEYEFQYLDHRPFVAGREAVLGSINWYDYSFADPELQREYPEAPLLYRRKLFPQGRHNDGRFVRLGMGDEEWTGEIVARFQAQLDALPKSVKRVIAVQHHPPVRELFYPTALTTVEQRFWLAYTGNRRMEAAVLADPRTAYVICGHTHAHVAVTAHGRRCLNVGGDYDFKRLLLLDTATGEETWWEFGR